MELSDIYRMDLLDGERKIVYGHTSVDKSSYDGRVFTCKNETSDLDTLSFSIGGAAPCG